MADELPPSSTSAVPYFTATFDVTREQLSQLKSLYDSGLIDRQVYLERQRAIVSKTISSDRVVALDYNYAHTISPSSTTPILQDANNVVITQQAPAQEAPHPDPSEARPLCCNLFWILPIYNPRWNAGKWALWFGAFMLYLIATVAIVTASVIEFGKNLRTGIPIVSIGGTACGWIAIGQFAVGFITIGQFTVGVINISMVGIGLAFSAAIVTGGVGVSLACFSVGLYSIASAFSLNLISYSHSPFGLNLLMPFFKQNIDLYSSG